MNEVDNSMHYLIACQETRQKETASITLRSIVATLQSFDAHDLLKNCSANID